MSALAPAPSSSPGHPVEPPALTSFDNTAIAFATKSDWQMRKAHLLFSSLTYPWLVRAGIPMAAWLVRLGLPGVRLTVKHTVFEQFCGGESIQECEAAVEALGSVGVQSILDYSVEGEKSEDSFDATTRETIATIEWAASHPHIPFSVFKVTGLARFGLLEKLGAGEALSADEQAEWSRVRERVLRICERAHALGVRIFLDGEETWIQDVIDGLGEEMMVRFNRERALVYNTYQMYRTASLDNLRAALERAKTQGYFLGAKLVRGAYMEKERLRAKERCYADPIQPDKAATDAAYDSALRLSLEHLERMGLCAGTHNEESCLLLMRELAQRGIAPNDPRVFFSQLYGMSDNISFNLARAGYNVAKYLPYGPVRAVLPYLIRRAQENSAIAGQGGREVRLIRGELQRRKQARALPGGQPPAR
ncbi:L-proline dehydrogenase [Archangium gephyra]|uniref:Carbapenem antibiotics biosynthesis protein carD n=1 Tax=Archangium gephyra TaxID=48 RepID=A0AAC8TH81_9BACT|nr:proline dehydrogenase family protein [Archangium gephyra]AKJ04291.1 Carbapenem antibiotics biosynthesis protein carD [Archangium gephyra]REG37630.1 L-proline dehydrogenase [Archangium gephyra]